MTRRDLYEVLGVERTATEAEIKSAFPEVTYLTLAELVSPTLTVELSRSLTRYYRPRPPS